MLRSWSCRRHQRLSKSIAINASLRSDPAKRAFSRSSRHASSERTRNIGIIAHIDAGKTTTTERMLYYSGYTRRLGDVDEGSTVTDFLPAERARGITIQSAAISFSWPPQPPGQAAASQTPNSPLSSVPHNINLIDTPGHADFTFEVLRSLRVLDGAVCILDGVAGVEAQTEKVWAQSLHHSIPRIVFVNKLDRDGAAFGKTVKQIGARLGVWPAVCSVPWWIPSGGLRGVADVINLRGLEYLEGGDGKQINVFSLQQLEDKDLVLANELKKARVALVELLSEHDDIMVEKYFETDDDHTAISPIDMVESLRRCTLSQPQRVSAVFAGASFRNVGVQPLLDAVVDLLPAPSERPDPAISLNQDTKGGLSEFLAGNLKPATTSAAAPGKKALSKEKTSFALQKVEACALAFKVVADAKRGMLVYVRVYSGSIVSNSSLWNTNLQVMERSQRLMKMYANDAVDVESIPAGQIGVIPALKFTRTGDTLVGYTGANPKTGPPAPANNIQLKPIDVPPPVFFVSVEANSLSEEKHIKESLDLLLREDPSLHVSIDEESGQTHLAGMGELHLEIARDRLIQDLNAKARIGNIEIGYREAITADSGQISEVFDREIHGKSSKAGCTVSVSPRDDSSRPSQGHSFELADNNFLTVLTPTLQEDVAPMEAEQPGLPEDLPLPIILPAFSNGASAALARGPSHGYPIHSAHIELTFDHTKHIFPNTRPSALSSAARIAVQKALRQSAKTRETVMMEPVMQVTISVDEASLGSVVHDISSARGGSVISLGATDEEQQEHSDTAAQTRLSFKDLERIYAPPDPFSGGNAASAVDTDATSVAGTRQIVARVPLKEMVGYLKHLRSLTAGRGTFTMVVDRFERMAAQRQKAVLNDMRGEY